MNKNLMMNRSEFDILYYVLKRNNGYDIDVDYNNGIHKVYDGSVHIATYDDNISILTYDENLFKGV